MRDPEGGAHRPRPLARHVERRPAGLAEVVAHHPRIPAGQHVARGQHQAWRGILEQRDDSPSVNAAREAELEERERRVAEQIDELLRIAREESDFASEQFMQWFIKEQVEEVASMTTLLRIVHRAGDNLFHVEDFVAREMTAGAGTDPTAPPAAPAPARAVEKLTKPDDGLPVSASE